MASPSDGTYTNQYDAEGNLTQRDKIGASPSEERTYTWDQRNRLIAVTDKLGGNEAQTVTKTYDVFDQRITKDVAPFFASSQTGYPAPDAYTQIL